MQLAQKETELAVADQHQDEFEQQISALHAELSQQHAEVRSLRSQLEAANEREMAASVAADLDHILDDPDQLPAEIHQLMSSLRQEGADSERGLPAKLQHLQRQLQKKDEEMQQRDATMQQLLRGADRIEDVQKETLAQLADAQSQVFPCFFSCPLHWSVMMFKQHGSAWHKHAEHCFIAHMLSDHRSCKHCLMVLCQAAPTLSCLLLLHQLL